MLLKKLCLVLVSSLFLLVAPYHRFASAADQFPSKPAEFPAYLNFTDIKYLDAIAKFELRRAKDNVHAEFAMVILEDLPSNRTVEQYAADLFKAWELGRNDNGRGILYVLVHKSGLLKIETSYELESTFPDAFIHSYQDIIKEFFNQDQLGDVISHLVVEMIKRVKDPTYQMSLYEGRKAQGKFLSGGAGISEKGYAVNRIEKSLDLAKKDENLYQAYAKAESPQEAVEKFLSSLKEGISSPYLGILTEGSRYMAMEYHRSASYQKNRYEEYRKVMPYRIEVNDGYAVALFQDHSVRPIYLRANDQGLWFVDETRMWSSFDGIMKPEGLSYSVVSFLNSSPWSFAFGGYTPLRGEVDRPDPISLSVNLKERIQYLEQHLKENPNLAQSYFDLGDVFFFENYWIKDALSLIEKGLALDPMNETYLRRAIYLSVKLPDFSKTGKHYETLLKIYPESKRIKYFYKCFEKYGTVCF